MAFRASRGKPMLGGHLSARKSNSRFGAGANHLLGQLQHAAARKPGLGGAGGSAHHAPAAPRPHVAPQPDSLYNSQIDLANRQQQASLNDLQGQERSIKYDFGLEDPTNPFSRANALKQAFLAKYKGESASLASQGHLYSGAHERALARTRLEEEHARADLRSAYERAINTVGAEKAGVKFNSEQDKLSAFEDWLNRAPEPTSPASSGGGAKAKPASKPAPAQAKAGPGQYGQGAAAVAQGSAPKPPAARSGGQVGQGANALLRALGQGGTSKSTKVPVKAKGRTKVRLSKQQRQALKRRTTASSRARLRRRFIRQNRSGR